MLTLLFGFGGCFSSIPVGDSQKPDVILVSIDTLRADHLSCYGYERETSPFLDRLAKSGTQFLDARSPSPWTLPTHTTMMTGLHPHRHGVVDDSVERDPNTIMLAQVMKESGYETAGFVSSLYVSSIFGFEKGFDFFEDFSLHTERENLSGRVSASEVVDRAITWWKKREPGKPVFLFLHFYDAHYAYEPPEPYNSLFDRPSQKGDPRYRNYFYFKKHPPSKTDFQHLIAQYDESIRYIDDQLLRLHDSLDGRSVRWVITSDHGEEFGERNIVRRATEGQQPPRAPRRQRPFDMGATFQAFDPHTQHVPTVVLHLARGIQVAALQRVPMERFALNVEAEFGARGQKLGAVRRRAVEVRPPRQNGTDIDGGGVHRNMPLQRSGGGQGMPRQVAHGHLAHVAGPRQVERIG